MKLPCILMFPGEWGASVAGMTSNMHRDGVLVSCDPGDVEQDKLPRVGSKGRVQVELPANPSFSPKCIVCDTTLVRVHSPSESEMLFAMRIGGVAFKDLSPEEIDLLARKSAG